MKVNISEQMIETAVAALQTLKLEVGRNNSAIQQEIDEYLKGLEQLVLEKHTAIQQDFEQRLKELNVNELKSAISATQIQLANVTVSLREHLNIGLINAESQINHIHNTLQNQLALLNESVNLRLNLVNQNVERTNAELPAVLNNVTMPLEMSIAQLNDLMLESLETLKIQLNNNIHDLEQQLNKSNSQLMEIFESKYLLAIVICNNSTKYHN